jgi:hypothetical protein
MGTTLRHRVWVQIWVPHYTPPPPLACADFGARVSPRCREVGGALQSCRPSSVTNLRQGRRPSAYQLTQKTFCLPTYAKAGRTPGERERVRT